MSMMVKDKAVVVDSARLLKKFPEMIKNSSGMVMEGLQNSMRAGATRVEIVTKRFDALGNPVGDDVTEFDHMEVTVSDNGAGCDDIWKVLALSRSGWDDHIQDNQSPAGWGVYHFIAFATFVTFRSKFGTYRIDCKQFLNSADYRNHVFVNDPVVFTPVVFDGFSISVVLPKEHTQKKWVDDCLLYDAMTVVYNGELLLPFIKTDEFWNDFVYLGTYDTADVYFEPFSSSVILFDYFGHGIVDYASGCRFGCYVRIREKSIVTPVLPYRKDIKDDEAKKLFYTWLADAKTTYYRNYVMVLPMTLTSEELYIHYIHLKYIRSNYPEALKGLRKTILCFKEGATLDYDGCRQNMYQIVDENSIVTEAVKIVNPYSAIVECVLENSSLFLATKNAPDWVQFARTIVIPGIANPNELEHGNEDNKTDYFWDVGEYEYKCAWCPINVRLDYTDDIRFLAETGAKSASFFYDEPLAIGTTTELRSLSNAMESFFEHYIYSDDYDADTYETQFDYFASDVADFISKFKRPNFPNFISAAVDDWITHGLVKLTKKERDAIRANTVRFIVDPEKKIIELDFGKAKKVVSF